MTDHPPQAVDYTTLAFSSPVTYIKNWVGIRAQGTLVHDGKGNLSILASNGTPVFDVPVASIGTVRRNDFIFHFTVDGNKVQVIFGGIRTQSLVSTLSSTGQLLGIDGADQSVADFNRTSGVDAWTEFFRQSGVLGETVTAVESTKRSFVAALIITAVVIVVVVGAVVGPLL